MNQTDLNFIDAHIHMEIHKLEALVAARQTIYQHLEIGVDDDPQMREFVAQLTQLIKTNYLQTHH